jgi:hypothetical protein
MSLQKWQMTKPTRLFISAEKEAANHGLHGRPNRL